MSLRAENELGRIGLFVVPITSRARAERHLRRAGSIAFVEVAETLDELRFELPELRELVARFGELRHVHLAKTSGGEHRTRASFLSAHQLLDFRKRKAERLELRDPANAYQ